MHTTTIELVVPDFVARALDQVAEQLGIGREDLIGDAVRFIPGFQAALQQQPEFLLLPLNDTPKETP
ncbi:MAG: hypothetical protein DI597_05380 [Pseudoxanthomonas spadix]|nr:MAG: hypothetical protein DI597_05380 [Pseudoxanthomonas spadix]